MSVRIRKSYFLKQFIPLYVWGLISAILFLTGCSVTLPDIKPFAEQTTKMAAAAGNAYTQAESLLSAAGIEADSSSATDDKTDSTKELSPSEKLRQEWEQTRRALHAMVEYSNALAALADTGDEGSESAGAVAEALQELLGLVGLEKISGKVVGGIKKVNEIVAAVKTKESLKEAIEQAQKVIDPMCKIIAAQLEDLEGITEDAGGKIELDHIEANKLMKEYYEALMRADEEMLEILALILNYQEGDAENLGLLRELDKDLTKENVEQRQKYWMKKAKAFQAEANRYLPRYQMYITELRKIRNLTKNSMEIIRKSKIAVEMWPTVHEQLEITLDAKQRMSLIEFAVIVQDIYNAYKKGVNE